MSKIDKSMSSNIYGELRNIIITVQNNLISDINDEFQDFYQSSFKKSLNKELNIFDIRETGSILQENCLNKVIDTIDVFKALLKELLRKISSSSSSDEAINELLENLDFSNENNIPVDNEKLNLKTANSELQKKILDLEDKIEMLKPYFYYTLNSIGRTLYKSEIDKIKKNVLDF